MVDVTATIDWSGALTPGTQAALARALTAGNAGIERINAWRTKRHAEMVAEARRDPGRLQLLPTFDADFAGLAEAIADPNPRAIQNATNERDRIDVIRPMLKALAVDPDIGLPALLKTIRWFNLMTHPNGALHHDFCQPINARIAALGEPSLTDLGQALIDMGISPRAVILATVGNWAQLATFPSIQGALPFFRQHAAALVGCFEPATLSHDSINRRSLYLIVEGFDDPPAALVDRLFELALGSGKTERGPAQAALEARPETPSRIIAALADGKAETRTQAANWLARLRYAPALPALEKAVRSEKNDVAKGALLDALQRLGQPVSCYIDRAALLKDAQKLLAKPLPDELKWMAWETMPVVRWADGGAVETDVLRYLIVNACKQKTPEPNAVLRKYCELFEPGDRARFGEWMLASWIAADSKPHPYEVVQRNAQKNAQSMYDFYQRSAAADDPLRARTIEQWYARSLADLAKQPVGSEIASKGVLAVAAACGSAALAPPTARYLKDFYGTRAAHCKALIAMLAWVEHPSATQLMLAIGKRFRTKGIQEEANKQALLLAERNDWTLDELADRTIPTGGLDDDGVLDLSYGERAFSAVLVPDAKAGMKLELRHPDGKTIASLPEPRADDDAELAAAAKKNLALAKKEIKTAIDAQTQRLYEALCTSRTWRFDLFDRYLNRHPLMSHLVQRLVWCASDGRSFRPMADGSLSGNDDSAVTLAPEAEIRIAHDLWLDDAAIAAWQQHLSDYDIKPLFQQFGKGRYTPPDAKAEALTEARGVVMDAFTLRGRMAKLGFARGPVEDGPSFNTYEKRLPSLQLGVILEFSGNSMPEENRKIALIEMRFVRLGELKYQMQTLPLGDVPPVLLAESHHDLKTLARDGVLDPAWQQRFDH